MFVDLLARDRKDQSKLYRLILLLHLLLLLSVPLIGAESFEDILGQKVSWTNRPERIVSLSPSITEVLFTIGCDTTNVVGVTTFCNYPPEVKTIASVGGIVDPSLEAIMKVSPDLVLVTRGNTREFMKSLKSLDIPVFAIEGNGDLQEIIGTIVQIGDVVGRSREAGILAGELHERLARVLKKTEGIEAPERPRVYFGELDGAHWTPGPGSFTHALIEAAGGANIGAVAVAPWSPLSLEVIYQQDPEVMLGIYSEGNEVSTRDEIRRILQSNEVWSQTSLGRNGRVFLILDDRIQRPGPRVFDVLEEVLEYLHPGIESRSDEAID